MEDGSGVPGVADVQAIAFQVTEAEEDMGEFVGGETVQGGAPAGVITYDGWMGGSGWLGLGCCGEKGCKGYENLDSAMMNGHKMCAYCENKQLSREIIRIDGYVKQTKKKRSNMNMHMSKTKKAWLPGLLMLCFLYGLLSCRKENLNGSQSSADSTAVFSAVINGTAWSTDSVSAFLVGDYRGHNKVMDITGYTSQKVIAISLLDTTTSGNDSTLAVQEYDFGSWGNAAGFAYASNRIKLGRDTVWQQQGEGISGLANVTASDGVNKRVSGTFSFKARVLTIDTADRTVTVDSVVVTSGVFKNIAYSFLKHP
jgi:hypothetical protein